MMTMMAAASFHDAEIGAIDFPGVFLLLWGNTDIRGEGCDSSSCEGLSRVEAICQTEWHDDGAG
jgi:hypothetical protein